VDCFPNKEARLHPGNGKDSRGYFQVSATKTNALFNISPRRYKLFAERIGGGNNMVEIRERTNNTSIIELEKTFQDYKNKLESAEQEAQQIIDAATKKAETVYKESHSKAQKMVDEMRQVAKSEAENILAEASAKALEAETVIKEQLSRAQKIADDMIQMAKENSVMLLNEAGRLIGQSSQNSENVLTQFHTQMQSEFNKLTTNIDKVKGNPDVRNAISKLETSASNDKPYLSDSFKGQIKLMVIPPYNDVQTKELIELFKKIPSVKIESTSTMEDSFSVSLNFLETVPLKRIISSISLVESSEFSGGVIKLKLKRYKIGGIPYY
jgi:F0F1-type ATP synthase membrane subunit b/b'